jgi:hypothetical protein
VEGAGKSNMFVPKMEGFECTFQVKLQNVKINKQVSTLPKGIHALSAADLLFL